MKEVIRYCWPATLLVALIASPAPAQTPLKTFERLGESSEFSNVRIYSIDQDEQGFLWFASGGAGIARFDGYDFRVFQHDPGDPNSLADNEVLHVNVGPAGFVWASTSRGLSRFDPATETFTTFRHVPSIPNSLPSNYVTSSLVDENGTLWVGTGQGLARRVAGSNDFTHYPLTVQQSNGHAPTTVEIMMLDSRDALWVGTLGGGLLRFDTVSGAFTRYLPETSNPATLSDDTIRSIAESRDGKLWVGTDEGLNLFDPATGFVERFGPDDNGLLGSWIGPLLEDEDGKLWISVHEIGLQVYDPETGRFDYYGHRPVQPRSLGAGSVWSIFKDRGGILWLGTDVVNRHVPPSVELIEYRNPIRNATESARMPNDLIEGPGGRIWIGHAEGLDLFDPVDFSWKRSWHDLEGVYSNDVIAMQRGNNGEVWAVHPRAVSKIDPDSMRYETAPLTTRPTCVFVDSADRLWLCQPRRGLVRFDFDAGKPAEIYPSSSDPASLSHSFANFAYEDRAGRFWVGTFEGLNLFNPAAGTFKRYFSDEDDPRSISDSDVRTVFEDASGNVWFGTAFGLNRYEPATDSFDVYLDGTGARENDIGAIAGDRDGSIWVQRGDGIRRFLPGTGYAVGPGALIEPGQGVGDMVRTGDGRIYMATSSGLLATVGEPAGSHPGVTKVALTGFSLFNEPTGIDPAGESSPLTSAITELRELELDHTQSMFSISFAAPGSRDPQATRYAYRLEGYDARWISADPERRVATYTDLPPGSYGFSVRAASADGGWGVPSDPVAITILPPWWLSTPAYFAYFLAAILAIWGLVQLRTHRLSARSAELETLIDKRTEELLEKNKTIRKQARDLEALVDAKNRYIANISHEFRTPLTVILGPIERILNETADARLRRYLDATRRNSSRLLRLVDKLLGLSRIESGQVTDPSPQAIAPVIRHAVAALSSLAEAKDIRIDDGHVDDVWAYCADDVIEEVVVNLLSNAIKYSPEGARIQIASFACEDDDVCVVVEDTGPGIPIDMRDEIFERFYRGDNIAESVPGSGLGLALVKELVQANGGSIALHSDPGKGARFDVRLPRARKIPVPIDQPVREWSTVINAEVAASTITEVVVQSEAPSDDRPTILLVEDNADLCRHIRETLGTDYRVVVAHEGEKGIELAVSQVPDLVICDVMLPKVNGFEVTRQLKQDERTSHIPIMLLTALADQESKLRGFGELADDYITKPFNEPEFRQRVETLLAIRAILRQRFSREVQLEGSESARHSMSKRDQRFIERVEGAIEANFRDPGFSTIQLAELIAMSDRQLQRKLKALTDMSPREYLRNYRLARARELLLEGHGVSESAFRVGFDSQSYFSKCFRALYDVAPSQVSAQSVDKSQQKAK